ncbi:hypothetical protein [Mycoplasma miroungirhinis]|uniref:Uncharacterized protein n=1 Tax=Mycoplasma miroungirhinis TaxID=754516 RepID=A0A6M4JDB3_9MOLU|nr:hypothetical protein [Mycoplasma miroungirhinis]QJR44059.1 hypothetical protein HLA92_01230 [Mycoplasma miroungirhinis]
MISFSFNFISVIIYLSIDLFKSEVLNSKVLLFVLVAVIIFDQGSKGS